MYKVQCGIKSKGYTHIHVLVSGFFVDPDMENEMIENFEEYLPLLLENRDWISNTSIFAAAIQDFYLNGNVSLDFKDSITKVSLTGRINLCC